MRTLYHRKIWLTVGCPRIDDIGGKIHRELELDSRICDFKRNLITDTLVGGIFKTHQAMLAYGQSKLEYQAISIDLPVPMQNPAEEEKHPENEDNRPSHGRNSDQVNQKLT